MVVSFHPVVGVVGAPCFLNNIDDTDYFLGIIFFLFGSSSSFFDCDRTNIVAVVIRK